MVTPLASARHSPQGERNKVRVRACPDRIRYYPPSREVSSSRFIGRGCYSASQDLHVPPTAEILTGHYASPLEGSVRQLTDEGCDSVIYTKISPFPVIANEHLCECGLPDMCQAGNLNIELSERLRDCFVVLRTSRNDDNRVLRSDFELSPLEGSEFIPIYREGVILIFRIVHCINESLFKISFYKLIIHIDMN